MSQKPLDVMHAKMKQVSYSVKDYVELLNILNMDDSNNNKHSFSVEEKISIDRNGLTVELRTQVFDIRAKNKINL
jgi:hypothetical protein